MTLQTDFPELSETQINMLKMVMVKTLADSFDDAMVEKDASDFIAKLVVAYNRRVLDL